MLIFLILCNFIYTQWCVLIATLTYPAYVLPNLKKIVFLECLFSVCDAPKRLSLGLHSLIGVQDVLFFELLNFFICSLYSVKCEIIQCSCGLSQSLIKSYFIFVKIQARIKSYICPLSLTMCYCDANILGH